MLKNTGFCLITGLLCSQLAFAHSDSEQLKQEIAQLKQKYNQRLTQLEQRLQTTKTPRNNTALNPELSVILDGFYVNAKNNPGAYKLPGFPIGGEAALHRKGFSLGHTEISMQANIDNKFRGQFTAPIHQHDGNVMELELEEAFIETLGLGKGFTVRAGRFLSNVGYINAQHDHAWDFADAPLVYNGIWGSKYIDDGLRLTWVAPTRMYLEFGAEGFAGDKFPAGGSHSSTLGSRVFYTKFGDDIDASQSWQMQLSYYDANVNDREAAGGHHHHHHGHTHGEEVPSFSGDNDVIGIGAVYKWAPNGNFQQRYVKLQGEYFRRKEQGTVEMENAAEEEISSLSGIQSGFYVQGVYQFIPMWRAGLRYDQVNAKNKGDDTDVLNEAGLLSHGHKGKRYTGLLEWAPSEFSRIRLQYNIDKSYAQTDKQLMLQYTMSLGAHGAHTF